MTIVGAAGTGKSYVINMLVTLIRQLTNINDSVIVCGPTGAAAFNINGKTLHKECGINQFKMESDLTKDKRKELIHNHKHTLLFIIDERSMVSNELLGKCERNMAETVFGGNCNENNFGGIPVVLLVGDDYQLPPVVTKGKGKGAFYMFEKKPISTSLGSKMKIEYNGIELFKSFSQTVMEMTERFRQKEDPYFVKILEDLYTGYPSKQTVQILMKLHLQKLNPKIQQ